jgi:hypothetical protein
VLGTHFECKRKWKISDGRRHAANYNLQ